MRNVIISFFKTLAVFICITAFFAPFAIGGHLIYLGSKNLGCSIFIGGLLIYAFIIVFFHFHFIPKKKEDKKKNNYISYLDRE